MMSGTVSGVQNVASNLARGKTLHSELPEAVVVKVLLHVQSWRELLAVALVDRSWQQAASAAQLRPKRQTLCRRLCLPHLVERAVAAQNEFESSEIDPVDWSGFCMRQQRLQAALQGTFAGTLGPESTFSWVSADAFDWGQQHQVVAEFASINIATDSCGRASQRVLVDGEELDQWTVDYEWLVLDLLDPMDFKLWNIVSASEQNANYERMQRRSKRPAVRLPVECPEEKWEDGDCYCGVRGGFDFRPAVDPCFLDVSSLAVLLVPPLGHNFGMETRLLAPRLYAPCAWMFPKVDIANASVASLDQWAEFRNENTVAALTLGLCLERAITYTTIEALLALMRSRSASGSSGSSSTLPADDPSTGRRKSRRAIRHDRRSGDPRDHCSGRNPKGLNQFVPRRKESLRNSEGVQTNDGATRIMPKRGSSLNCSIANDDLQTFLSQHPPSKCEVERLQISVADCTSAVSCDGDGHLAHAGLLDDTKRLEACNALSHDSVVELARKWHIFTGKWLIFVPQWRVDDLFVAAARRLESGAMEGCVSIAVMPPGTRGIDPDLFMLSAHTEDFTDRRRAMLVGKCLRAAAREGLRCPTGDWGELRDDPFAAPGKKVVLVYKPDVFSILGLHRNNPLRIKTTIYSLDL